MHKFLTPLAVCALLCISGAVPPAHARGHSGISNTAVTNPAPGTASQFATVSPLPSRPPVQQMAQPALHEGQIGAAPNPGPITGYGPGGMGRISGSPPNPPYR